MAAVTYDFTGTRVAVTGAGRGLGRDIALGFARSGADVALCDLETGLDALDYEPAGGGRPGRRRGRGRGGGRARLRRRRRRPPRGRRRALLHRSRARARRSRRARQQRRRLRRQQADHGDDRRAVGSRTRRQPERAVPLLQARRAAHAGARGRRPDHLDRLNLGTHGHPLPGRLPVVEDRHHRSGTHACARARPLRRDGERRLPHRDRVTDARVPRRALGLRTISTRCVASPALSRSSPASTRSSRRTSPTPCCGSPRTQRVT